MNPVRRKGIALNFFLSSNARPITGIIYIPSVLIRNENDIIIPIPFDTFIDIFGNFLRNSIYNFIGKKHIENKYVKITARNIKQNNLDCVELHFIDNGLGIPENLNEEIFTDYSVKKEGERGIGLQHIKREIEALDGTIEHIGQEGVGVDFKIIVPLIIPDKEEHWHAYSY